MNMRETVKRRTATYRVQKGPKKGCFNCRHFEHLYGWCGVNCCHRTVKLLGKCELHEDMLPKGAMIAAEDIIPGSLE